MRRSPLVLFFLGIPMVVALIAWGEHELLSLFLNCVNTISWSWPRRPDGWLSVPHHQQQHPNAGPTVTHSLFRLSSRPNLSRLPPVPFIKNGELTLAFVLIDSTKFPEPPSLTYVCVQPEYVVCKHSTLKFLLVLLILTLATRSRGISCKLEMGYWSVHLVTVIAVPHQCPS
jgi:hypothetical protein